MLLIVERRVVSWVDMMLATGVFRALEEILRCTQDDKREALDDKGIRDEKGYGMTEDEWR